MTGKPTASTAVTLLAGALLAAAPSQAYAEKVRQDLVLDNNFNCIRDNVPAPDPIGVVKVTELKGGRLKITARFFEYGGLSNERYHLDIGIHSNKFDCHGDESTIPRSYFTTTQKPETGKKSVIIDNPQRPFHIDVCNDDYSDCSYAGNFVYENGSLSVVSPSSSR